MPFWLLFRRPFCGIMFWVASNKGRRQAGLYKGQTREILIPGEIGAGLDGIGVKYSRWNKGRSAIWTLRCFETSFLYFAHWQNTAPCYNISRSIRRMMRHLPFEKCFHRESFSFRVLSRSQSLSKRCKFGEINLFNAFGLISIDPRKIMS